ncbi:4962_t:CDS:2, partial [Funneliformis mosseae]
EETGIWQHFGRNNLSGFMKELVHKSGIEVDGLLTNHYGRMTSAQLMQNVNAEEQVIMKITGHQSVDSKLFSPKARIYFTDANDTKRYSNPKRVSSVGVESNNNGRVWHLGVDLSYPEGRVYGVFYEAIFDFEN